ncbi:trafficking PGA2-domain-containing protein [Aspergillus floccosus]
MSTPDEARSVVADALADFFGQLYSFFETIVTRFFGNLYLSFAQVSLNRWTKVILSVVGYILARPYIEAWFKKMADRDFKKQQEKEKARRAALGDKKAKVSANALRGGASSDSGSGKVLGEVENTDDEIEEEEEDFATASGVPEWSKNARKRQKKFKKNLEAEGQTQRLSKEQIMELLDWSDEEGENAAPEQ